MKPGQLSPPPTQQPLQLVIVVLLAFAAFLPISVNGRQCNELFSGQYRCKGFDPRKPTVCFPNGTFFSECYSAPNISCINGTSVVDGRTYFYKPMPCKYTSGYSFEIALLLSIFLGWAGIDRFYLGYPALGLLKLCTFGFMFLWHLVDILLIALQIVLPADGSFYVMNAFSPVMTHVSLNNNTYFYQPGFYGMYEQ